MRVAREIKLTDALRESLEKAARARTASVRLALRAKMILSLMLMDGLAKRTNVGTGSAGSPQQL